MAYTRKQRKRKKMLKQGIVILRKGRAQRRSNAAAIERSNTVSHRGYARGGY